MGVDVGFKMTCICWISMKGKRTSLVEMMMEEKDFHVQLQGCSRVLSVTKAGLVNSLRLPRENFEELWKCLALRPGCRLTEANLEDLVFLTYWGSKTMEVGVNNTDTRCAISSFRLARTIWGFKMGVQASADH